jgi:hypothetical protein
MEVPVLKSVLIGTALLCASSLFANAQDRVIVEERPAVTVPAPAPGVTIERRGPPVVERREVETTGRGGCDSKTVRTETPAGSKSVTKERCD